MQTIHHKLDVRAVAFREGDQWVIQCLEYDITAHAPDPARLPQALSRAIVERAAIAAHLGKEPFKTLPRAPQRFHEMFDRAHTAVSSVRPLPTPEGAPRPNLDIRFAEFA